MARLLGDRRVVIALALAASLVIYQRIVVPLLPDPAMSAQWDGVVDEDEELIANAEALAQPQLKLATAQFDLRNIDIGALVFNESPARDPFVDRPVAVAPLAEVQIAVARPDQPAKAAPVVRPRLPLLTAIAFASDDRAAVLDNQIVRTGDAVARFEVTAIARRQVTLRAPDRQVFTLTLSP